MSTPGIDPQNELMASIVFWTCCALLVYVYVLYPLIVSWLAARFGSLVRQAPFQPSVTIIVPAYNEERCIRAKLDNISHLDYPRELIHTIVVSDASSDATEEIAARYDPMRVSVLRVEGRRGKTACQNRAAAAARGEILVFADATTQLRPDALRQLMESFSDATVGCVAGRLEYVTSVDNVTGHGNEMYWSYELRVRAAESLLGSLIGVSGCLYAVRRSAYIPIDDGLISDFVIAMKMREQGLRTVLAVDAVCFEETLNRGSHELSMRVRVAVRSLNALIRESRFLNPWTYGRFAWQLWSHKALRYASPILWLAALIANVRLSDQPLYSGLLIAQCALIASGVVGFFLQARQLRLGLLAQPYYFLLTNVASLIAMVRYLAGDRMVTWKPIRP
jgi:cellulose synthase/poly-beta-1,6-N-acetylglucosamine synthase-like glycosyltransferase